MTGAIREQLQLAERLAHQPTFVLCCSTLSRKTIRLTRPRPAELSCRLRVVAAARDRTRQNGSWWVLGGLDKPERK